MKLKHVGKKLLAFVLAASMLCSVNTGIYAEDATEALPARVGDAGCLEIPNTTSTFSKYNASFLSVNGFASEGVHDRTEYLNTSYHAKVKNGAEFVEAVYNAKQGTVKIIELLCDIYLNYDVLTATVDAPYSSVLLQDTMANASATITNPLIAGGVGKIKISETTGLTIFSQYGATINHGTFQIESTSSDIVIRNIAMDGVWQWDNTAHHKESGITFIKVNGKDVWIDHCSFTMAQDGLIDLEQGANGVTISWCKIGVEVEEALDNESIVASINWMEEQYQKDKAAIAAGTQTDFVYSSVNIQFAKDDRTIGRYPVLREAGITPEMIMKYTAYHSKVHLIGSGDKDIDVNPNLEISLGYNWYRNVAQRIPMIRQGTGHVYNCYIDDMAHSEVEDVFSKDYGLSGDYRMSRCIDARNGASIAADTCVFYGVNEPMIGSEKASTTNFANTYNHALIVNSKVINTNGNTYSGSSWDNNGDNKFAVSWGWADKATIGKWAWKTVSSVPGGYDAASYTGAYHSVIDYEATLPYSYQLVPLDDVEETVKENAGMGTYDMTPEQWCRTTYEATENIKAAGENKVNIASSVKFVEEEPVIYVGDKTKLEVITTPLNITDAKYTWTVSSMTKKYATVDSATGELTALKPGTAKLTCKVTSLNGTIVSTTVNVIVKDASEKPAPTATPEATETVAPPTETVAPPTETVAPPTETVAPPTETVAPPTETVAPPTETVAPPTETVAPPTETVAPPTETVVPPTETPDVSTGQALVAGDADLNGDVTLDDANLVLKAALGIVGFDLTGQALEAADVDGKSGITLEDANGVLKLALGIPYEPKKPGENPTEKPTEEPIIEPTAGMDLEEARKWFYTLDTCYDENGEVIIHADLERYSENDIPSAQFDIDKYIDLFKAHGYSYDGSESDVLAFNKALMEKHNTIYYKFVLTDPYLEQEVVNGIVKHTAEIKGWEIPEKGSESYANYLNYMESVRKGIKDPLSIGMKITYNSSSDTYRVWMFGRCRFDGNELVNFTENMEWSPNCLIYNAEDKIWYFDL